MAVRSTARLPVTLIALTVFGAALALLPGCSSAGEDQPTLKVRPAALAGTWYPASAQELQETVDALLTKADVPRLDGRVVGLIAPHAAYQFSGPVAAHSFKALRNDSYRTVVLMGPSHQADFQGCLIADVDAYETPLGKVALDKVACEKLLQNRLFRRDPSVHLGEHSIEIQLPLLQRQLGDFKLVPIIFASLALEDYDEAARAIREASPPDTLYVVSSDFIHYGESYRYVPFDKDVKENLSKLDHDAVALISARNFAGFRNYLDLTHATICGRVPIGVLLKLLPGDAKGTLLKYYTSADLTGDWKTSVSYAALAFTSSGGLSDEEQRTLLRLARDTLKAAAEGNTESRPVVAFPDPYAGGYALTPALREDGAVFVTLTVGGELRGCIGTLAAVEPLCRSVVRNTVNASRDPRFPVNVQPAELPRIRIEISVLSRPTQVDSLDKVVIGRHGLIIEKAGRSAVFLPQVAGEQGWSREEMAANLCMKAGLPQDAWKEGATLRVFTAHVFSEDEAAAK